MCGIVAAISLQPNGFDHSTVELFQNLLLLDQLRGGDSTGVFGIDREGHASAMKLASHPSHLFACDDWDKWKGKMYQRGRIMVGHNRAATKGAVTSKNAHPFHENNILLVHNGTLRGDHKKLADTEVDSHAICHAFNEKGAEEVIPTLDAAFAFIWWDFQKERLYVIRNPERPLSMVMTGNTLFFASESWMPVGLLRRSNSPVKIEEVTECEPYMLYEFTKEGRMTTKKLNAASSKAQQATTAAGRGSETTTSTDCTGDAKGTIKQIGCALVKSEFGAPEHLKHVGTFGPFTKGEKVLIRLVQGEQHNAPDGKTYRKFFGKVVEPSKPSYDVIAYAPNPDGFELPLDTFLGRPVVGKVLGGMGNNCGPTIYVNELFVAPMVDVHPAPFTSITLREWSYVLDHCKCKECGSNLNDIESEFTHVKRKANNVIEAVCADCVEDKLEGEFKNEFQQRRNRALQIDEPVGDQSSTGADGLP